MLDGRSHPLSPILIVDDVASQAIALESLCHSLGVETLRVANAAEAAAILASMRPAAIITDLVLAAAGHQDGFVLIARYLPTVPVMVVAASEPPLLTAVIELGESYGLSDLTCVAKPVDLSILTAFLAHTGVPFRSPDRNLH